MRAQLPASAERGSWKLVCEEVTNMFLFITITTVVVGLKINQID